MTTHLPIVNEGDRLNDRRDRLLIICPLADIYSGVGNFAAPCLGPWRLAFNLRENGFQADVWDCNVSPSLKLPSPEDHAGIDRAAALAKAFVDSIEADFNVASYGFIGFSILNDTLAAALGCIQLIRQKYPQAKLIGGNHEATVNLQDCLGKSQLDAVILADAEEPMQRLLRGDAPHTIPGVVWRSFNPKPPRETFEKWNAAIRWQDMPFQEYWTKTAALYDWASMTEEEQLTKQYEIKCIRIHTLLSCELPCSFCSVSQTRRIASGSNKPSIVNLSASALEQTFLAIKEQVPDVMTIYDSSDEAWLGKGRADEYLDVVERVKPIMDSGLPRGLRLLIQCRTNDLDKRIIDRAARAGVKHLTIGVESPIAQVRKDIKKPQSEELIRNVAKWCTERDINAYMLFIAFLPTVTLEQLYEAVANWRIYISLGATISIEPYCMSYLSTALHDDAALLTEHANYDIPFSGTPAKKLKWATLIWPHDRRVCTVLQWTRSNLDNFIAEHRKRVGHAHMFKGETGQVVVDCIEQALNLHNAGELPPWEPGEGRQSMVYQDYGDQMSGSEIATAARMIRRTTTTRFNSTHSLLDDTNAGVKGRIKDPALPHEFSPKKP